jgi:glycosyltransferase involved in cell wall biosynthesis
MRVAMISFDAGEYSVQLCSALAEHAEVLMAMPSGCLAPHRAKLNPAVQVHEYDLPRLRQATRQIPTMWRLWRRVTAFRPDVVHVQHTHLWCNFLLPLLRRYPLVITVHDPVHHAGDAESQRTPQALVHWGYHRADELITHAERLKRIMVDDLGYADDKVVVIPHVAQGYMDVPPGIQENGRLLLFFGRIWAYKGLDYLIRAEPLIAARVPDVQIMIAGRGEDFERYRAMMVHPERFIVRNEYISDEMTAEYFAAASVVVLPYIDASQSGVIPIAYSFGKPVVATTVGGLPEVVDDGVTGLLVPPRDEHALAEALIRLLEDADLRRRMGAAGKHKLDTEFAPSVVAARTVEVYRRVIAARRS